MKQYLKTSISALLVAGSLTACAGGMETKYLANGRIDEAACLKDGGVVRMQGVGGLGGASTPMCLDKNEAVRVN